jgi:ATP-dependent RNA helicase DeaD
VSHASGTHEGVPDGSVPRRHADFSTWQPPAEEGDDEPILTGAAQEAKHREAPPRERGRRGPPQYAPSGAPLPPPHAAPAQISPAASAEPTLGAPVDIEDQNLVEIYVNVGRRDGARAADYQQVLTDKAGMDRANVRRIRVRERNAFVSVRREDLPRALAALNGASLAGKVAMAEQARGRGEGEPGEAAHASDDTRVTMPIAAAATGDAGSTDAPSGTSTDAAPDAADAEPITGRSGA